MALAEEEGGWAGPSAMIYTWEVGKANDNEGDLLLDNKGDLVLDDEGDLKL